MEHETGLKKPALSPFQAALLLPPIRVPRRFPLTSLKYFQTPSNPNPPHHFLGGENRISAFVPRPASFRLTLTLLSPRLPPSFPLRTFVSESLPIVPSVYLIEYTFNSTLHCTLYIVQVKRNLSASHCSTFLTPSRLSSLR